MFKDFNLLSVLYVMCILSQSNLTQAKANRTRILFYNIELKILRINIKIRNYSKPHCRIVAMSCRYQLLRQK